ncbi:class I SAM-dependent methyltransferase [Paenibacillus sp. PL91]|uniref:class I SAM-dependent methyltransferase n=1 Tax=Paenibacillus sp. PL91 TaxID=2729538 RepID=UPI00145DE993|nr:class I SAM-dependent methyltransferase [Paenibacillus sp. PL91]MBC9202785.1 class I SAM-dependent methyltransferase [Paenibacillus sp. PL91]
MRRSKGTGDRYWQNWDNQDVAKKINEFWLQSDGEDNWRALLVGHIQECLGYGANITEIGCGSGLIGEKLLQMNVVGNDSYKGGDISEKMLILAKDRLPDVKFFNWDILNLDIDTDSQPNVICIHVLQHLPSYNGALPELVRVAKDSLYIACWFTESNEDKIDFSKPSNDWEGQRFYNNVYSLPKFLSEVEAAAVQYGKAIQSINVHKFSYHENYAIHILFAN